MENLKGWGFWLPSIPSPSINHEQAVQMHTCLWRNTPWKCVYFHFPSCNHMDVLWFCKLVNTHNTPDHLDTTTTVLRPLFQHQPAELVPEENFWTLWCKGRITEADTLTTWLGTTPSGLTSAHLHHPPFFTGRMPFLPLYQQCQSIEALSKIKNWTILPILT